MKLTAPSPSPLLPRRYAGRSSYSPLSTRGTLDLWILTKGRVMEEVRVGTWLRDIQVSRPNVLACGAAVLRAAAARRRLLADILPRSVARSSSTKAALCSLCQPRLSRAGMKREVIGAGYATLLHAHVRETSDALSLRQVAAGHEDHVKASALRSGLRLRKNQE